MLTRDACYALHVRSRSHIDKTSAKKMTFAFFKMTPGGKSLHTLHDLNSTRTLLYSDVLSWLYCFKF